MKRLTQSMRILSVIASGNGSLVTKKEISKKLRLSLRGVEEYTTALRKAGMLTSSTGRIGGYKLDDSIRDKSLSDLFDALSVLRGDARFHSDPYYLYIKNILSDSKIMRVISIISHYNVDCGDKLCDADLDKIATKVYSSCTF